jgi:hypothetical protein
MKEIKELDGQDKERSKMEQLERSFSYSFLDIIFPYHMYLGKKELNESGQVSDYQYTTLRTFSRRRFYLLCLFNNTYDNLLTEEERGIRNDCES